MTFAVTFNKPAVEQPTVEPSWLKRATQDLRHRHTQQLLSREARRSAAHKPFEEDVDEGDEGDDYEGDVVDEEDEYFVGHDG